MAPTAPRAPAARHTGKSALEMRPAGEIRGSRAANWAKTVGPPFRPDRGAHPTGPHAPLPEKRGGPFRSCLVQPGIRESSVLLEGCTFVHARNTTAQRSRSPLGSNANWCSARQKVALPQIVQVTPPSSTAKAADLPDLPSPASNCSGRLCHYHRELGILDGRAITSGWGARHFWTGGQF